MTAPATRPTTAARPPRAELHLHLEGTLEPELAFALAARNRVDLPFADPATLRAAYAFSDLQSFLDLYHATSQVLRTAEDFADLTLAYLRRAAAGGVRHAELMVDLQTHVARGVPLEDVVAGVARGLAVGEAELGVSGLMIAAFLRHRPAAEADGLLDDLLALGAPVAGVGLASTEVGFAAAPFAPAFAKAAAHGLRRTAHAAEEGPAWHVTEVLDALGAERVDHGIRALEDAEVVARLVREQVPLTVCPVSNVRLGAVASLGEHPLPAMLAAGLNVSLNSDDPSYFGGYVDEVDDAVTAAFGLTRDQRADLAAASFRGSFLPAEQVARHVAAVEEWRAAG
ncbi:adenosine deaminase [Krasilnikoviella flava]|nr:adenosine deaminase [Krasilnikoviella flava]